MTKWNEEERSWWPICSTHGVYNIREIQCPKCVKSVEMLDSNNGHASGLPHPQNENCSVWGCKEALGSILDAPMKCESCGKVTRLEYCLPDVDGEGSPGCPVPNCGGITK